MQTHDEPKLELVELGSVTADTAGGDGPVPEGFTLMIKTGMTAD